MKLSKKKVFVSAVVVCLLAMVSAGSLAWFSASDSVKNEFLFATSEDDTPEGIFSVDVWEEVGIDEDGDGNPDKIGKGEDDKGHEYTDILPGSTYTKEPHVENTGSYDQYIRVTVTISDATAWIDAVGLDIDMRTVFAGFDEDKWDNISKNIEGETDTVTYVLYYNDILESKKDITLFEGVNIPTSLTQKQAAAFEGGFTIDILAEAVQTENVGKNAFEAFQTVEGN